MEKYLKNLLKKIKLNEPAISTILGGLVILTVGVMIFNYFKAGEDQTLSDSTSKDEQTQLQEFEEIIFEGETATYKVQEGDHLWKISEKFYQDGYKWTEIAQLNNLTNPDYLEAGQELQMPKPTMKSVEKSGDVDDIVEKIIVIEEEEKESVEDSKTITEDKYTVKKGDYLWDICIRAYADGYKWPEVAQLNNLAYPDYLEVGQELTLPR